MPMKTAPPEAIEPPNLPSSLRIASYNASGLDLVKMNFCDTLLEEHRIDILLVQETFWSERTRTLGKSPAFFCHLPHKPPPTHDPPRKNPHGLAVFVGTRLLALKNQIHILHKDDTWQSTLTISIGRFRVTNVYLRPSLEPNEWTSAFRDIPKVPMEDSTTVHVLLGDWNVRLSGQTGDRTVNRRAKEFNQLIQSHGLVVVPFQSSTPTFMDKRLRSSTPDFALVSASHLNMCSPVTVLDNDNGTSDHFPIVVDLNLTPPPRTINKESLASNPRRIATHLLEKNSQIRQRYVDEVSVSLKDLVLQCRENWTSMRNSPEARVSVVQEMLDNLTTSFTSTLISSAQRHCKQRRRNTEISKSTFAGDSVLKGLREQRIILLRQLRTYYPVEEVRVLIRNDLNRVNHDFAMRIKVLEREHKKRFFDSLETKTIVEQQRCSGGVRYHRRLELTERNNFFIKPGGQSVGFYSQGGIPD